MGTRVTAFSKFVATLLILAVTIAIVLLITSCKPAHDVDPFTGLKISSQSTERVYMEHVSEGIYEWKYKDHWFMGYQGGGIIHAPYCECNNKTE